MGYNGRVDGCGRGVKYGMYITNALILVREISSKYGKYYAKIYYDLCVYGSWKSFNEIDT